MKIESFIGGFDKNFMYLIHDESQAIVVDPFDPEKIVDFCKKNNLKLKYLVNTHSHFDHVYGNKGILESTKAELIDLNSNEDIELGGLNIKFIKTPGHTEDGRCLIINDKAIITGDTLFVGGIGFMKTLEGAKQMYKSLKKLSELQKDLIVYPGHDYGHSKTSTIGKELLTNPYLQHLVSEEQFLKSVNMA